MNQIFHIIRKDLRHHWKEVVLCQAALASYCWRQVDGWNEPSHFVAIGLFRVSSVLAMLLPLSWWLLISRAIQDEALVGDRQFWITRPYEWKKLLAAKAIFFLVFLNLPLLVAGMFLLARAGFGVFPHFLGLLWMQILLLLFPLLPLAALAAVTRNLAHGLVAILLVFFYLFCMVALVAWIEDGKFSSADGDWILGAIVILAVVSVLWIQYAQRRTLLARTFLGGAALVITLVSVAGALFSRGESAYALLGAAQRSPIQMSIEPATWVRTQKPEPEAEGQPVYISVPITLSGLPHGSLGHVAGIMLTLETPDGFQWHSGWSTYHILLGPGEHGWAQPFEIKYKSYRRLKGVPVKSRVSLALDLYREPEPRQVALAAREFSVPEVGRCRIDAAGQSWFSCRSPLTQPEMVVARLDPATSTCPVGQNKNEPKKTEEPATSLLPYAVIWGRKSDLPNYGVSPIESFTFNFGLGNKEPRATICLGTPISFSFPKLSERTRIEFETGNLNLEDYRLDNGSRGTYMIGLGLPRL